MAHTLIDIYNNILKYDDTEIIVIFDKDNNIWFSGIQISRMLEYKFPEQAIRKKVKKIYKKRLDELTDNPKEYGKNTQPHSIFINEAGLYTLINSSKQDVAKKFKEWIFGEVLPKLRQTGKYELEQKYKDKLNGVANELEQKYKKQLEQIKTKINQLEEKNRILENNQKKNKFPKGGVIYVVRPFGTENENLLKVGKTNDLKSRMNTYNTGVPNNMEILYSVEVKDPIGFEHCIKSKLRNYIYRERKEFYNCDLEIIIDAINKCDKFIKDECYCCKCENKIEDKQLARHIKKEYDIIDTKEKIYGLFVINNDQSGGMKFNDEYTYLLNKANYLEMSLSNNISKDSF